jgi:PAS domain S-box-containing protein
MYWQFYSFMIPLFVAALTCMALAVFAWRRRPGPGVVPLVLLLLAVTFWTVTYILELGTLRLEDKVFWSNMQYFGITAVPPIWLVFVLAYTKQDKWLTHRNLLLLLIEPVLTIVLIWTNDFHQLFRSGATLDTGGDFSVLVTNMGVGFWVHAIYSYVLLTISAVLLIRMMIRSPQIYRDQTFGLLLATFAPWLGNAIFIFTDFPLDLTPMGFTITGLALSWALFRFRLLDIVPIARDAVIENLRDGVIALDLQNRIVDLNPSVRAILGDAKGSLVGRPLADILPEVSEHIEYTGQTRVELTLGQRALERDMELHISPLHDRQGRITGHIAMLHDITPIKRTEKALRESEDRYRSLLEATFESIIIHEQGQVRDVNQAFEHMFGYTREEILGQSVLQLATEDTRDRVAHNTQTGAEEPYEAMGLRKDGTTFHSEVRGKPLVYQGRPARVAAVRDITERKQIEASLQRRLRETLLLNRVIATATSILDTHLVLEIICEELARAFKLPQAAIGLLDEDGKNLTIVAEYLSEGRPSAKGVVISASENAATRHVLRTGAPLYVANMPTDPRMDAHMQQEARRRGTISLLIVPLLLGERVIGTLGLDSTEPREFTQDEMTLAQNVAATASQALERARLYETLQQELAERRRAQEELAEANVQLAEVNRLKSHFLANMSHELRTPLNSILGYAEMLMQGVYGPVNDRQLDRLEKVTRNGQMLLQLINDILDISKIEAGRTELELAPAHIDGVIGECVTAMEPLAERKGLKLHSEVQPVPPLLVDRGRLLQVLNNLVGNAIKFTPSGTVTVRAQVLRGSGIFDVPPDLESNRRGWGVIIVEDTGIGIAQEDQQVIFDEFRQVDSSTTRKYEGTGLGLAIVRRLVELMHGRVWLESAPGQGSRFFVALPVAEEA